MQIRHNPYELLDISLQPIMFVVLFTYVFGGAIAGSTGAYLTFALPGIIVMNMIFLTMYVGMGLNTDLTKGVFDRLRSLPIARWAPLAGRISADLVKQAWSIVLLLVVGFILGFRLGTNMWGLLGATALLLLFALAFSWISVLVGVVAKDPEKVQVFGFTALFPITFVSNVFVQTETMPGWLQPVVKANPVSILADAARGLHGRRPRGPARVLVAGLGGRHRAGLRAARRVPVQAPRLSTAGSETSGAQGGGEVLQRVALLAGRGEHPAAAGGHAGRRAPRTAPARSRHDRRRDRDQRQHEQPAVDRRRAARRRPARWSASPGRAGPAGAAPARRHSQPRPSSARPIAVSRWSRRSVP